MATPLKHVKLTSIISSSPDFSFRNLSFMLPTGEYFRTETLDFSWESIHPFAEETMVVVYFVGTLNQTTVVYPLKVMMTVSF